MIRPEFIQSSEDNLPNAYLQPQWPMGIPDTCSECGKKLHPKLHLSYGSGKMGRAFKKLAWWITLPWGVILFIAAPMLFSMGGNGGIIGICILILVPGTIFSVLASICPRSLRVQCYVCDYSKDYRMD